MKERSALFGSCDRLVDRRKVVRVLPTPALEMPLVETRRKPGSADTPTTLSNCLWHGVSDPDVDSGESVGNAALI
jgi:hypothetical protein